jgi:two-component system sensor histidine kinase KdpD
VLAALHWKADMRRVRRHAVWRFLRNSAAGVCVIAALTFAGRQLGINALFVSCLYLVTVTLLSLTGDFAAAVIVSIAAFASLDYFFVPPFYSFRVSDPSDTVALFASLVTALIVTSLVSRVRVEARDSRVQRQRLERLYQLAQQLLAFDPAASRHSEFLEPFLGVFGVAAVCVFDAATADLRSAGTSRSGLPEKTRDAYIMGADLYDEQVPISVRLLRSAGKLTGAIGFEGLEEPRFTAGPLTALAVTLLDRGQALRKASEAAAAAQVEVYRAAVLDSLAHEFKTPLATILAAAGGLREAGPMTSEQMEMADTVESEAARLGNLTSQLLRTARLDSQEIKPRMEAIDITPLVHRIAAQYSGRSRDRRIVLANARERIEVLADPELLRLPVSQLIENACKYSPAGSTVTIEIARQDGFVAVRVSNSGSSIPVGERHRIFERFYRGAEASRSTSGSGLGLYVARRIAVAHSGALDLESADDGVTFCLKIPATKDERTGPGAHPCADHEPPAPPSDVRQVLEG